MELRPWIKLEPCQSCGGDPKIFLDGDAIGNVNLSRLEIICACGEKLVGGEEIISEWNRKAEKQSAHKRSIEKAKKKLEGE